MTKEQVTQMLDDANQALETHVCFTRTQMFAQSSSFSDNAEACLSDGWEMLHAGRLIPAARWAVKAVQWLGGYTHPQYLQWKRDGLLNTL
jgi:hypothetical protein